MQCTGFTTAKKSDYPKRVGMVDTEMARRRNGTVGTRLMRDRRIKNGKRIKTLPVLRGVLSSLG